MQAPYLPLFDSTLELDEDARRRIGLTTALLFVRRQEWVHRRVELVTFADQDVIRRSNSIDFTLPRWTAAYLKVSKSEPSKIAVPIALLRKATLAHFNLSDEGSNAIPLLSGTQVGPLAELALLATAELALESDNIHSSIAAAIRQLTWDRRADDDQGGQRPSSAAFECLFSPDEPEPESRLLLKRHPIFLPLAEAFDENYIAAVLLTIAGGDRRVVHFAYDEMISETGNDQVHRRRTIRELFKGNLSRRVLVLASSAGDAESFHMEAEAPEGLRISSRVTFTYAQKDARRTNIEEPVEKSGSYQRSHIHCNDVHASDRLAVVLRVGPRSSTVVRGAALTAALTLLAVIYIRIQIHHINRHGAASTATVLLVIPTILSLWIARSNEHPATTYLLWPLRIVATAPAIFGLIAASVLITGSTSFSGETVLATIIGLLTMATWILVSTWRGASGRQARYRSLRRSKSKVAG
ncbi:MAG TPA: hypothetical protein VIH71_16670 [Solirubrobacteraceae bacterium]